MSQALNELPRIKYALNFNGQNSKIPDSIPKNQFEPIIVFYDSNWVENSENLATYYRTGSKDSIGGWSGPVNDYYMDGKIQMKGEYFQNLKHGVFLYYSPIQRYEASGRYEKEFKVGKWEYFHPNGKIFKEVRYVENEVIVNAWDSLGNPLVIDGEGKIESYFENGVLQLSGTIKNGLKEGMWVGYHKNGAPYFEEYYKSGNLEFGRSVSLSGDKYTYDVSSFYANPDGGYDAFYKYLRENIRIPGESLGNNITGKVTVKFDIGLNGSLSNFIYLNKLGYGCEEEAKRLLLEGPAWLPGRIHGYETFRSESTVTVFFEQLMFIKNQIAPLDAFIPILISLFYCILLKQ